MEGRRRTGLAGALAARISEEIRAGRLAAGEHLAAQPLADRFGVSRSPIARALQELAAGGLVRREARRGYFVPPPGAGSPPAAPPPPGDPVQGAYLALAEDRLEGRLPEVVSASLLRGRYGLSPAEVQALAARVAGEGWLERRPGYGFRFTDMLSSAEALLQTYRVRAALEPAALLEPGYALDAAETRECRRTEEHMLAGGIESLSAEALYDRGVRFHETVVAGSRNPFFLDALRRINAVRRLLAYRSSSSRARYHAQARDHLEILDLLEAGRQGAAAERLGRHLRRVMVNLDAIRPLLEPGGGGGGA